MKNRLLQLILQITYIAGLIFYVIFFYFGVKNIILTYYIIIISFILLVSQLVYWYSVRNYKINFKDIFLLRLTICVFIYISPVYCIIQEPFIIVNNYISLATLSIVTLLAILGIYIERWLYIKESEVIIYEKKF